ncbi:hypothetical protein SUDANB70_02776 [Streptomyces sp. enrichment culture]
MDDTHPRDDRYDTFEAVCTKREKAHEPGTLRTARAGGAPTRAARPHLGPGPDSSPYETTAGSADLGSGSEPSPSPTAIPRRFDT